MILASCHSNRFEENHLQFHHLVLIIWWALLSLQCSKKKPVCVWDHGSFWEVSYNHGYCGLVVGIVECWEVHYFWLLKFKYSSSNDIQNTCSSSWLRFYLSIFNGKNDLFSSWIDFRCGFFLLCQSNNSIVIDQFIQ